MSWISFCACNWTFWLCEWMFVYVSSYTQSSVNHHWCKQCADMFIEIAYSYSVLCKISITMNDVRWWWIKLYNNNAKLYMFICLWKHQQTWSSTFVYSESIKCACWKCIDWTDDAAASFISHPCMFDQCLWWFFMKIVMVINKQPEKHLTKLLAWGFDAY